VVVVEVVVVDEELPQILTLQLMELLALMVLQILVPRVLLDSVHHQDLLGKQDLLTEL
jgi:hypothetical protein